MKVGIISYYKFEEYIIPKPNKVNNIYESWHQVWDVLFKFARKNNINLEKYTTKNHSKYQKLIYLEIPRIQELSKIIYHNIFCKKIETILIINETFIGRARYILNITFLFDKVLLNSEKEINQYKAYNVKPFSYPTIPSKKLIQNNKESILCANRKNKIVFIGSFKLAINKYGTYIYRYKLIKELLNYPDTFKLYGFNWDKKQIPFDLIGIAIIKRIKVIKKLFEEFFSIFFKPLGNYPKAEYKYKTLRNYDFSLVFEPTKGKFNSICEKIFDPMLSGTIPIYYGQKDLNSIPKNTYIRIFENSTAKDILKIVKNFPNDLKKEYRKNIYNFLISESARKYRYKNFAKIVISSIKET